MRANNRFIIAPSLLSADFARLGEEATAVLNAGADMLHLDVMDNHYVPNLTVGPVVCEALRNYGITAPIDVHLMTIPVDSLITDFADAGASQITFHPEASEHVDRSLAMIRHAGCKAGLALNPATTSHCLEHVWEKIDMVLVMSVNPGFSGQAFIPAMLGKIKHIRTLIDEHKPDVILAVDGGIKTVNLVEVAKAGANMFVSGSGIFDADDYGKVIAEMRALLG